LLNNRPFRAVVCIPRSNETITEAEIRDVTHYCHFTAARQGKRSVVMYRFAEYTPFELLTALLRARSQTRQPLLRIRAANEPVARQLPQRRNAGSGDGEEKGWRMTTLVVGT